MLKIRPALPNEAPELLRIHQAAVFAKAKDFYDQARLEVWSPGATPDRLARTESEIVDPTYIVRVAEVDGVVIGFAMAIPCKNELRALYVQPNSVGQVGKTLLHCIEHEAFAAGAEFLAFDASLNAEVFYKANGYF